MMASPENYLPGNTPGATPAGWDSTGQDFYIPGTLLVGDAIIGPNVVDDTGHDIKAGYTQLTAGAVGTTVAGTISATAAAGAAPTITAIAASDQHGVFTLNPVTGGGAQAAGVTVEVRFVTPYTVAPTMVSVHGANITVAAAPTALALYVSAITVNGFSITTELLTTANNYRITYDVQP
jgi:hypothetical protein